MRSSASVRKLFRSCLLLLPLLILLTGCGSKQGKVYGTVFYKGKPLPGGDVRFFPEGEGGSFFSGIKSDGSYSIDKLPRGSAKVTVSFSRENPLAKMNPRKKANAEKGMQQQLEAMKAHSKDGGAASAENVTVPEKYNDPDKSGLKIDVTGGSQKHDINIE
jgi:hypothetical protein